MTATLVHASCVSLQGQGLLIIGASGTGKSGLALKLIALGCDLVADDQTLIRPTDGVLIATCPDTIQDQIEARGVGILACPAIPSTRVKAIVDMDCMETDRLPPHRTSHLFDCTLPLFHKTVADHFASALLLYLKGYRVG